MKTYSLLTLALTAGITVPLHAAPEPAKIAQWEVALSAREQRATLLRDELKAIDSRIEQRLDVILDALRSVGDSKDSRTKVARMKEQTIESLKKNIGYYQTKRSTLVEELRRPTLRLTDEQKRKGIALFDKRVEERITQILEVQKSLPEHKDYERYKATGSDWYGTTYAINEDHRQNQRVTGYTNSQRKEVSEGLKRSIERLENQGRALKAKNAPAQELAANDALLAERRKQLAIALTPSATATKAIGLKEAVDLDKALQTAIVDLRKDFNTFLARYAAFLQELAAVNVTRDAITAAKPKGV